MTVCTAFCGAVIKIVYSAPSLYVNSIFELCLRCFFSVHFDGSGMLRDALPAKSSVRSSTPSPQCMGARYVVANSKRG